MPNTRSSVRSISSTPLFPDLPVPSTSRPLRPRSRRSLSHSTHSESRAISQTSRDGSVPRGGRRPSLGGSDEEYGDEQVLSTSTIVRENPFREARGVKRKRNPQASNQKLRDHHPNPGDKEDLAELIVGSEGEISPLPAAPPARVGEDTISSLPTVASSTPETEPLSNYTCPICFSPPVNATLTPCGHICCGSCLFTAVKTTLHRGNYMMAEEILPRCPVCRAPIPGWDGRGGGVIGLKLRAVFSL